MNNTLKYRVFLKSEKKMLYPEDRTLEMNLSREILKIDGTCYYFDSNDIVIMQSTGLLDRNGTLIYKGDIVYEHIGKQFVDKRIVRYIDGSFIAESSYSAGTQAYGVWHEKFQSLKYFMDTGAVLEVIGNIWENNLKGGEANE